VAVEKERILTGFYCLKSTECFQLLQNRNASLPVGAAEGWDLLILPP
jgi:hypothetical protein